MRARSENKRGQPMRGKRRARAGAEARRGFRPPQCARLVPQLMWILLHCASAVPQRWGAPTHLPLLEAGAEAIGDLLVVGSFSTGPPRVHALGLNATSGSLTLVAGPTPHVFLRCNQLFHPSAFPVPSLYLPCTFPVPSRAPGRGPRPRPSAGTDPPSGPTGSRTGSSSRRTRPAAAARAARMTAAPTSRRPPPSRPPRSPPAARTSRTSTPTPSAARGRARAPRARPRCPQCRSGCRPRAARRWRPRRRPARASTSAAWNSDLCSSR